MRGIVPSGQIDLPEPLNQAGKPNSPRTAEFALPPQRV